MKSPSLAAKTAANNSNLGNVKGFNGATLVFDIMKAPCLF